MLISKKYDKKTKPVRNTKKGLKMFKESMPLTLLVLPALVVTFIFRYIPLYGLLIPFKNFNVSLGIIGSPWAGLENFKFLIQSGSMFTALRNTILYNLVFIAVTPVFTIAIALMLFELSRTRVKIYQTAMLIPHFMSWVVVTYILNALLDMDSGILNQLRAVLGKEPILWYSEPSYWPFILVAAHIWQTAGYSAVVYYAALMGIDSSYFEAAKIDGATRFQQVIYISLPTIKPIFIMLTILNIGKIFYGDFGMFYNLPLNSPILLETTDVIDTYVYRSLISLGDIGMSSATGFCQSIFGFILVIITNFITKKIDSDNALF